MLRKILRWLWEPSINQVNINVPDITIKMYTTSDKEPLYRPDSKFTDTGPASASPAGTTKFTDTEELANLSERFEKTAIPTISFGIKEARHEKTGVGHRDEAHRIGLPGQGGSEV